MKETKTSDEKPKNRFTSRKPSEFKYCAIVGSSVIGEVALVSPTIGELELAWKKVTEIPLNRSRIQMVRITERKD